MSLMIQRLLISAGLLLLASCTSAPPAPEWSGPAAEPLVAEIRAEPPNLLLEWDAVTGGVYHVQGAGSLSGPWSALGPPVTSTVSRASALLAPTNAFQHLRVRLDAVP